MGNSRKIHLKRIVVSVKFKSIQTRCERFKHTVDDEEIPQKNCVYTHQTFKIFIVLRFRTQSFVSRLFPLLIIVVVLPLPPCRTLFHVR